MVCLKLPLDNQKIKPETDICMENGALDVKIFNKKTTRRRSNLRAVLSYGFV